MMSSNRAPVETLVRHGKPKYGPLIYPRTQLLKSVTDIPVNVGVHGFYCRLTTNISEKRKSQLHPAKPTDKQMNGELLGGKPFFRLSQSTALRPELTDFELTDTLYAASCAPLRLWSHNTDCGDGDCLLSRPTSYPVMPNLAVGPG